MMTNIVDGEQIADEIASELKRQVLKMEHSLTVGIVVVSENKVTESYVTRKRLMADSIGVAFVEKYFPDDISQEELRLKISEFEKEVDGLVVQLPLPAHVDTSRILSDIPICKDIDCLNPQKREKVSGVMGPVAGAVIEVLDRFKIDLDDKKIVVVGKGRLVGQPVIDVITEQGYILDVVDLQTSPEDKSLILKNADVIISGVGVSYSITPEMIKDGVVLIDAGTSSSRGSVVGDIHPDCVNKASLFSSTPGGIGPITIVKLFENLILLQKNDCNKAQLDF